MAIDGIDGPEAPPAAIQIHAATEQKLIRPIGPDVVHGRPLHARLDGLADQNGETDAGSVHAPELVLHGVQRNAAVEHIVDEKHMPSGELEARSYQCSSPAPWRA